MNVILSFFMRYVVAHAFLTRQKETAAQQMCRRFFGLWCLVVLIFVILNHVFGGEVKVFRVFLYCRAVAFFGQLFRFPVHKR